MALFESIRIAFRGAPARLAIVLGLTTGIALVSATLAPTSAHADQVTFGFSFGDDSVDDGFFPPDYDDRPVYRHDRPRYLYPSRRAPRVEVADEFDTDTVCHVVRVRVWHHGRRVFRDVERCREVPRW
jgi:hypothetical protein